MDLVQELRALTLFGSLDDDSLALLAEHTEVLEMAAQQKVFDRFDPADSFYAVVEGIVELVVASQSGRRKVVEIIRPQQSFGEAVMFLDRQFPVEAVAAERSTLLRIPSSAVDELVESHPQAARAMLASLSMRLHALVRDVEMYTVQPARERVSTWLLERMDAEREVRFDPSKTAVASRLGITPETLSGCFANSPTKGCSTCAAPVRRCSTRTACSADSCGAAGAGPPRMPPPLRVETPDPPASPSPVVRGSVARAPAPCPVSRSPECAAPDPDPRGRPWCRAVPMAPPCFPVVRRAPGVTSQCVPVTRFPMMVRPRDAFPDRSASP